jgi:hypothetical protein
MTASKISIYTGTLISDCVPEKVAYLTERAGTLGSEVGTLVFQPHRHFEFVGVYLQPLRVASEWGRCV